MSKGTGWKRLDAEEIAKLIHLVMDQDEITTQDIIRYASDKFKVSLTAADVKVMMWSLSPDIDSFDITWMPSYDTWRWAGTKRQSLVAIRREVEKQLRLFKLDNKCLSCRNYSTSGLCRVRGQKRSFMAVCEFYKREA
ncbi:TPA: hypothetical protein EYP44_02790 [Candidatus Bathyarchaeota archaeon]|nr:hypothetical protein [Candidatus Bathyarchaeota archaeon]